MLGSARSRSGFAARRPILSAPRVVRIEESTRTDQDRMVHEERIILERPIIDNEKGTTEKARGDAPSRARCALKEAAGIHRPATIRSSLRLRSSMLRPSLPSIVIQPL